LGVRKRVMKLLKSFYCVTEDTGRRVDISTRLILRMQDEDASVTDLAVKTMEELWFHDAMPLLNPKAKASTLNNSQGNDVLLAKVVVIMGVSANFKDRHSPFENMLHQIMADKEGTEASLLHARYTEICEVLIDGLVDASDLPGFVCIPVIKTTLSSPRL
jgi:cohesin loading factor subunit SCC2